MPVRPRSQRVLSVVSLAAVAAALSASGSALAATAPAPTISSMSATSAAVVGHVKLTVHGSGFTGVATVLFGSAKGGSLHVVSSSMLTVVVPAHKPGRLDVRVVGPHGKSKVSHHDVFTYVATPAVGSVSITSGLAGVKVTVKGSGFTHVKRVLFGKVAGTRLHVLSAKALTVYAPAHTAGPVDVRVVSSYGTSRAKTKDRFTFVVPPVIVAPNPVITTTALPAAERGQPYSSTIAVTSGTPPYTVSVTGLPAGIAMTAAGVLSGRSYAAVEQYPVVVNVTDAAGHTATASLPVTLRVHPGQVFAWGNDAYGQLGNGATSTTATTTPAAVAGLSTAVQVVGSFGSSYALMADGTVYAWGVDTSGALGDGSTTTRLAPEQIAGLSGIVSLAAAGGNCGFAVQSDGTLLAWGLNAFGELGDGTTNPRLVPAPVVGPTHVVQVVASQSDVYALQADGQVWSWGWNDVGQLGSGSVLASSATPTLVPGLSGVKQLAAKRQDAFALLTNGTVMGWGFNGDGEVGDVSTTNRSTPVPVYGLTGVTAIAAGNYSGYALMGDGTVRSWGLNSDGELGDGTRTTRLSPEVVPGLTDVQTLTATAFNVFATHPDGSVQVWGYGSDGSNADGSVATQLSPELNPTLAGTTAFGNTVESAFAIR